jgi:hypothetical protein
MAMEKPPGFVMRVTHMPETPVLPFFSRLWMAWRCFFRIVFRPPFASEIRPLLEASSETDISLRSTPKSSTPLPETLHASGLFVLSMLQREGRLLDFLQEDVAPFPDSDVGAAARIVHEGCRKVLRQYLTMSPILPDAEGATVTVPPGFDPQRMRLTGNVSGQPPFVGALKHHGWVATDIKLPDVPSTLDLKVLAPAEVEL